MKGLMWNNDSLVEDLQLCAEELSYESQARIAAHHVHEGVAMVIFHL